MLARQALVCAEHLDLMFVPVDSMGIGVLKIFTSFFREVLCIRSPSSP